MQEPSPSFLSALQKKGKQHPLLAGLQTPTDIQRLTEFQGFGLGGVNGSSEAFLNRFRLQVTKPHGNEDLLALVAPSLRGGSAARGIVGGIQGIQGGLDALSGTFRAISTLNGYLRTRSTTEELATLSKSVGVGGQRAATFANVVGNAVSLSNLPSGPALTAAQVSGISVALSAIGDVAATAASQTFGSVQLSNLSDLAATFSQKLFGSVGLSNQPDLAPTTASFTYGSASLNNVQDIAATAATRLFNSVALNTTVGLPTAATHTFDLVRKSNLPNASAAQFFSSAVSLSNEVSTPLAAASVTMGSVKYNPPTASATTWTAAGPISFSTNQNTRAETSFTVTQQAPASGFADFGGVDINGFHVDFSLYFYDDKSQTAVANWMASQINNTSGLRDQVEAQASNGVITLRTKAANGTNSQIAITAIQGDSDGNLTNDQANPFATGTWTGTNAVTDFGTITVNGVSTVIGSIASNQHTVTSAAQYIADQINANATNTVTASVDTSNRLVFTHKQTGPSKDIVFTNYGGGIAGSSTGLAGGTKVTGSNSGNSNSNFNSVTINGVTTNIGTYSSANPTGDAAAQFIVDRLNANATNTVFASRQGDRVILTQKTAGAGFSINVTAVGGSANQQVQTGFVLGNTNNGTNFYQASSNLGTIRINGVDTNLGAVVNNNYTATSLAQYIADKVNQNTSNQVTAYADGDRVVYTQKTVGQAYGIDIEAIGNTTNGMSSGLYLTSVYNGTNFAMTDFGSVNINGVSTYVGSIRNDLFSNDQVAQFIASKINGNTNNQVTALASSGKLTLTQKTNGSAYGINVTGIGNTANNTWTGLSVGSWSNGLDSSPATNFGSITINGVTTNLGIYNDQANYTSAGGAQHLANRINANILNQVVATVENGDQIRLTQKSVGSGFSVNVTNKGNTLNGTDTGLVVSNTFNGTDFVAATTDFGSVTINGVTTNIGVLQNNQHTSSSVAQHIADQINANALNEVIASLNGDQVVLTQKTAGASYTIDVTDKGNTANGADTGLAVGTVANGTDWTYGQTDFGDISINGVTTTIGSVQNNLSTTTNAAQFIVDQLNANVLNDVVASLSGDQIVLTQKTAGSAYAINVTGSGNTSDGQTTGLDTEISNTDGTDFIAATTDFGSVTLNGETTAIGQIQNSLHTAASAAQYIADRINANTNNTVAATVSGDRLVLTQTTAGSAWGIEVTAAGGTADGASTGLSVASTFNGTDPIYGQTDFGNVTINGQTVTIGQVQNNLFTSQTAADYIRDLLNANLIDVTASTSGDQITLTQANNGASYGITISNAGLTADGQTTGFSDGTSVTGTDAPATTDFGSITINGVTTHLGTIQNSLYNNASAAQYIASQVNANTSNAVVASTDGDKLILTAKAGGSSGVIQISAIGSTANAISTGLSLGATQNGEDGTDLFGGGSATETTVTVKRGSKEVVDDRIYHRLGDILSGINGALDRIRAERGAQGVSPVIREVENHLLDLTGNTGRLAEVGVVFELGDQGLTLAVDEDKLTRAIQNDLVHVQNQFQAQAEQLEALSGSLGYEASKVAFLAQELSGLAEMTASLKQAKLLEDLFNQGLKVTRKLNENPDEEAQPEEDKIGPSGKQAYSPHTADFRLQQLQAIAHTVQPSISPAHVPAD